MEAKRILSTDYLDLVFEGRNKNYGGYELRKHYNRRMGLAGLIGIMAVALLFISSAWQWRKQAPTLIHTSPQDIAVTLTEVELPVKPPPEKKVIKQLPKVNTTSYADPKIVRNDHVTAGQELRPDITKQSGIKNIDDGSTSGDFRPTISKENTGDFEGTIRVKDTIRVIDKTPTRKLAVFPKAPYDVAKYLTDNIRYPAVAADVGLQGTLVVEFVVNLDGSISDVKPMKELGGGLTKEAVRVISKMPKWIPGKDKSGNPQAGYFKVPVSFRLQK